MLNDGVSLAKQPDVFRPILFAALLLWPGATAAQEHPQPLQELFFTEVVYPQSKHEVQLTFGSLVDRSVRGTSALAPVSIEFGLTNRWQIEAGWDGYTHAAASPLQHLQTSRISLGTKYSLMNIAGSPIHAAFGLEVEFPRASAFPGNEGEDGTEFEPFVALAADAGHGVTIFGSAGLSVEADSVVDLATHGERPDDQGTIGVGALVRVHRITLAGEYTSRSDRAPWRLDGGALLTPSVVVHPGREWELGLGLPIALRGHHQPGIALHVIKEF
jgi:hypothetical protein